MTENDTNNSFEKENTAPNFLISKLRLIKVIDEAHARYESSFYQLSKREKEVLQYLALGMNSKAIGNKLNISKFTVDTHRKNIYKKTDLNTLRDIVLFALIFDMSL